MPEPELMENLPHGAEDDFAQNAATPAENNFDEDDRLRAEFVDQVVEAVENGDSDAAHKLVEIAAQRRYCGFVRAGRERYAPAIGRDVGRFGRCGGFGRAE